MNGAEIRMAALYLVTKLPPDQKDAIATLEEARRLLESYLWSDDPLPLDGKNSSSKTVS